MSHESILDSITRESNLVSFKLEDIRLQVENNEVADVAVNLDYIDGIDPSAFKDVIPLGNFIEDYLTNYSHPNDSFEVLNNNLGNALLTDSNLGLSSVLDSLTVTLGASPGIIPFQFNNTVTLTPIGTTIFGGSEFTQFCDINGIV